MDDKSEQIQGFMDTMQSAVMQLGKIAQEGDQRIGVGKTTLLEQPVSDSFGTFNTRKEYFLGCDIGGVVEDGGVAIFKTEDDQKTRVVEIGKVPPQFDQKAGGTLIPDAGTPNEHLLVVQTTDKQSKQTTLTFRYVDKKEITGAIVEKGKQASLNPSPERQIAVQGVVGSIISLR